MADRAILHARLVNPATRTDAVREIVAAYVAAGGTVTGAADRLGLPHRTLFRWIARWTSLRDGIASARDRIGAP